jgi:hypothetical protein
MAKPGEVHCPMCDSEFEVDDRLECIFADIDKIRLPANGTVCPSCGLVQGGETNSCFYCRMPSVRQCIKFQTWQEMLSESACWPG